MPIDPTGTSPQAVPQAPQPEEVNIKCKKCDSVTALIMNYPGMGSGQRMYRCTKCHHTWALNVGGHLDI